MKVTVLLIVLLLSASMLEGVEAKSKFKKGHSGNGLKGIAKIIVPLIFIILGCACLTVCCCLIGACVCGNEAKQQLGMQTESDSDESVSLNQQDTDVEE
eukprot:CAMPEP_0197896952 /NCGR_PEP_ID=MMETSP1439-20131203/41251_1 /TAXON_ID=66791 /ORGANISM="Gonyaulax spinifera, Strain CCMP409" /LENGTH=98 /DNA_ID=CAMNT_0043517541 /DNA_START=72 /DNA_END=368 /DNA_ORIENTATION=+